MISAQHRIDIYRRVIDEASRKPFCYGANDCMLLIAKAVYGLLGIDYAAAFGTYDLRHAARIVREHGGYIKLISSFIGEPERTLEGIRTCDPCIVEVAGRRAGGLWAAQSVTVLNVGVGVRSIPAQFVIASWRVG